MKRFGPTRTILAILFAVTGYCAQTGAAETDAHFIGPLITSNPMSVTPGMFVIEP